MNKKLLRVLTIALLTQSTEAGIISNMFGKKVEKGDVIDHNSTEIIIEDGDASIGELIYHPANVNPYTGETYGTEEQIDTA